MPLWSWRQTEASLLPASTYLTEIAVIRLPTLNWRKSSGTMFLTLAPVGMLVNCYRSFGRLMENLLAGASARFARAKTYLGQRSWHTRGVSG